MGEITETTNSSSSSNKQGEVEITVKTIGPFRPSLLQVSASIKVCDLRKLIASNGRGSVENLKLILRGRVLNDRKNGGDVYVQLNQGDTVMVAAKPRPPAKHVPDGLDEDNSDDYVRFRLPPTASKWKRELFSFLHKKLKIPDILLMAIFSLRIKVWAIIITWFMLAPIVHRWDLGPVYILGTGFAIIFFNLGQRQAGDVSAYSIFNDDFRELPGTLNADRLDRDIRAGQF